MTPGRVSRGLRAAASWICWTLAVGIGAVAAGTFAGGGVTCEMGVRETCRPPLWILLGGVGLAVTLGIVGALLWRPKAKRPEPLRPWEYRS